LCSIIKLWSDPSIQCADNYAHNLSPRKAIKQMQCHNNMCNEIQMISSLISQVWSDNDVYVALGIGVAAD
jgi:hypothetical protein